MWTPKPTDIVTAEQRAAEEAAKAASIPLTRTQVACARLYIDGWDIAGIERSQGIGAALKIDEDTVWVIFSNPQPDTNYYILPPHEGATKYPEYVEITCEPGTTELAFLIERVQ
jgi:hypothetical protein